MRTRHAVTVGAFLLLAGGVLQFSSQWSGVSLLPRLVSLASPKRPLTVACSSVAEAPTESTEPRANCEAMLPNTAGDWVSNHEKVGAWAEIRFSKEVLLSSVRLHDRGSADDAITDGHFEFSDGSRYPATGRLASVAQPGLPNAVVKFPIPVRTSKVRLVVDAVSATTSAVGLSEFSPAYTIAPPLDKRVARTNALEKVPRASTVTVVSNEPKQPGLSVDATEIEDLNRVPIACDVAESLTKSIIVESVQVSPPTVVVGAKFSLRLNMKNTATVAQVVQPAIEWPDGARELLGPITGTIVRGNESASVRVMHVLQELPSSGREPSIRVTVVGSRDGVEKVSPFRCILPAVTPQVTPSRS